jgi:AcrR family transcriptional regulator
MRRVQEFQRARSAEQRELRREAILGAAAEMLNEMPVSKVTMNGLSRRVGLAKSNVMRYFESREAVLLELLTGLSHEWLGEAAAQVEREVPRDGDMPARLRALASALARSFAQHEVLCDLISAETSVLEHNVSEDAALRYKRAALQEISGFAALIVDVLPELDGESALDAAFTITVLVGALWTHTHPSPAMAAVYRNEPSLAIAQGFAHSLEHVLATYLAGLLAWGSRASVNAAGPLTAMPER